MMIMTSTTEVARIQKGWIAWREGMPMMMMMMPKTTRGGLQIYITCNGVTVSCMKIRKSKIFVHMLTVVMMMVVAKYVLIIIQCKLN